MKLYESGLTILGMTVVMSVYHQYIFPITIDYLLGAGIGGATISMIGFILEKFKEKTK